MNDAADLRDFRNKLAAYDRPVLIAALMMWRALNPDVPKILENCADYFRLVNRPRRPGEKRDASIH
jgi:hypothetical protein